MDARSLFDPAGNPLPQFIPQTGGLANAVYTDTSAGTILKLYNKEKYYRAELMVASSGFTFMPKHLESGEYANGWYVLMERVGEAVQLLSFEDVIPLVSSLAALHSIEPPLGTPVDLSRFDWLHEYRTTILELTGRDVSHELSLLSQEASRTQSCLVHGDLDITNMRRTPSGFLLIDFDEAGYSLPWLDIGKLYWSGGIPMESSLLKKLLDEYENVTGYSISLELVHRWIFIAGADFWLWRYLHSNTARANQAADALREYSLRYGT